MEFSDESDDITTPPPHEITSITDGGSEGSGSDNAQQQTSDNSSSVTNHTKQRTRPRRDKNYKAPKPKRNKLTKHTKLNSREGSGPTYTSPPSSPTPFFTTPVINNNSVDKKPHQTTKPQENSKTGCDDAICETHPASSVTTSKGVDISDLFVDPDSPRQTESVLPEHSCSYLGEVQNRDDGSMAGEESESSASGSRSTDWNFPSRDEKTKVFNEATSTFIHDNQSSLNSNKCTPSLSDINKQLPHDTNSLSSSVHISIDDLFG